MGKTPTTLHGLWAVALALAAAAGCERSESRSATQRDSAAIRVVENTTPAWGTDQGWRIASIPKTTIGSRAIVGGRDEVAFERVQGARFLSDGRIVVADAGSREVMVFDTAGTLVTRFGGRGQGPGELQSIVAVHVCGEDSIAVVDSRQTLHLFDGDGTFIRRARLRLGERSASLQGVSTSCQRGLLQQRTRMPPLDRLGLTEDVFAWVDSFSEAIDTVTTAELLEAWTRSLDGAARPWVIPWGTSARTHATGNDQLVLGNGRVPELRRYDSAGELQLIVRWSIEPRPVDARDRRRYSEFRLEFLAWAPPNEPETRLLFPALDEYPEVPTHKPLFDRLLLDDPGGIWARVFPEESFGLFDSRLRDAPVFTETWTVFDSAGVWLGDLTLPERFELQAVGRDRLLGVSRDSFDTETVQVLRIEAAAGGLPIGETSCVNPPSLPWYDLSHLNKFGAQVVSRHSSDVVSVGPQHIIVSRYLYGRDQLALYGSHNPLVTGRVLRGRICLNPQLAICGEK